MWGLYICQRVVHKKELVQSKGDKNGIIREKALKHTTCIKNKGEDFTDNKRIKEHCEQLYANRLNFYGVDKFLEKFN